MEADDLICFLQISNYRLTNTGYYNTNSQMYTLKG